MKLFISGNNTPRMMRLKPEVGGAADGYLTLSPHSAA